MHIFSRNMLFAFLLLILTILSGTYTFAQSETCDILIDFEDLTVGSTFHRGDVFYTQNINFSVVQFYSGDGQPANGDEVEVRSGKYIYMGNLSIKPTLPNGTKRILFEVADYGGNLNLKINNRFLNFNDPTDIHNTSLGGVNILFEGITTSSFISGVLSFQGNIETFEIGGQELLIDYFCVEYRDCPFDPDFEYSNCTGLVTDSSISAGESNGFQYQFYIDGQPVYPNGIDPSFNGLVYVPSVNGEPTYGEHEGRLVITNPQGTCTEVKTKSFFVYPEIPDPDFTIIGAGCSGNNVHFEHTISSAPNLPPNTEYEYFWNLQNSVNSTIGRRDGIKSADDTAPISYDFTPPSPGRYTMMLTIRYRNDGCAKSVRKTFSASTLAVTHTIVDHYCSGTVTGDITLHVTGGSPPYQYSLNGAPPQPSNSYQGLAPGNYTITITDGSGCEVDHGVEITRDENRIPKITELCASPGPCAGASSAAGVNVKFTAQNGSPSSSGTYRYNIIRENSGDIVHSGTGTWNALQSVTVSGLYSDEQIRVIITEDLTHTIDLVQCPLQSPVIAVPRLIMDFAVTTTTPIEVCDDTETVLVTLSVTPQVVGFPSFCGSYAADRPISLELQKKQQDGSYQTVSAQTGVLPGQAHTFTFSGSGEYRVSATYDAGGFNCTSYFDFLVKKKYALNLNTTTENVSCFGTHNGNASINVTGNYVGALTYDWKKTGEPGFTVSGPSASGLGPGDYQVTVSGESNCPPATASFTIHQPTQLAKPVIVTAENQCSFYAELVQSGTPPYNFIWYQVSPRTQEYYRDFDVAPTGGTATSDASTNQPQPGEYYVMVIDANGCQSVSDTIAFKYPEFNRSYDIAFRWSSVEMNPPPPEPELPRHRETPSQNALEVQKIIENQIAECRYNVQEGIAQNFADQCFSTDYLHDQLSLSYDLNYDFYTLYYYDRAGNLARTVSPKGVDISATERDEVPLRHSFVTAYDYNSLRHRIKSVSPDAGTIKYLYNDIGQLRFSQNARQADVNDVENENGETRYTYSKYDKLGRIIEVGDAPLSATEEFVATLNNKNLLQDQPAFPTMNTDEETFTVYSEPAANVTYLNQPDRPHRFLDNRISYAYTNNRNGDTVHTYYSYDPHGNVEWMANDLPQLKTNFIGYEYDLLSGKILKINYQEGYPDQFFHKYTYDEDNRITAVSTSVDDILWDNDIKYRFYDHGPIRGMAMGEYDIQKVDYVYTINGWLKAFNTPDLRETAEEGIGKKFSQDLFGMTLGYFPGDFSRINSEYNSLIAGPGTFFITNDRPLFNGNISYWVNKNGVRNSEDPFDDKVVGHSYTYDVLGRLKKAENHLFAVNGNAVYTPQFETAYSYDKNGNFLTLSRNGGISAQLPMDAFTYNYYDNTNRLKNVPDSVTSDPYDGDIQAGQNPTDNNYIYDASGNLIRDNQEGITLRWNAQGKLSEVIPDQSPTPDEQKPYIQFSYDSLGQRVKKTIFHKPYSSTGELQRSPDSAKVEFYSKYHMGENAALYELTAEVIDNSPFARYKVSEFNINGDKRYGVFKSNKLLSRAGFDPLEFDTLELVTPRIYNTEQRIAQAVGKKQYEIKDHLLNPRVVVSDKKIFHPYTESDRELIASSNYYPFGSQMPGRAYSSIDYRYGFNGMERDDEIKGSGNSYTTHFRQYDSRLGRWLSRDPKEAKLAWNSTYVGFDNNPILFNDPLGDQIPGNNELSQEDLDFQASLIPVYGAVMEARKAQEMARIMKDLYIWDEASYSEFAKYQAYHIGLSLLAALEVYSTLSAKPTMLASFSGVSGIANRINNMLVKKINSYRMFFDVKSRKAAMLDHIAHELGYSNRRELLSENEIFYRGKNVADNAINPGFGKKVYTSSDPAIARAFGERRHGPDARGSAIVVPKETVKTLENREVLKHKNIDDFPQGYIETVIDKKALEETRLDVVDIPENIWSGR